MRTLLQSRRKIIRSSPWRLAHSASLHSFLLAKAPFLRSWLSKLVMRIIPTRILLKQLFLSRSQVQPRTGAQFVLGSFLQSNQAITIIRSWSRLLLAFVHFRRVREDTTQRLRRPVSPHQRRNRIRSRSRLPLQLTRASMIPGIFRKAKAGRCCFHYVVVGGMVPRPRQIPRPQIQLTPLTRPKLRCFH